MSIPPTTHEKHMNQPTITPNASFPILDLIAGLDWEDSEDIEFISLEEAGLEEFHHQPRFGSGEDECSSGGIFELISWYNEEPIEE